MFIYNCDSSDIDRNQDISRRILKILKQRFDSKKPQLY
jgi:hypothetical protein